MNFMVNRVLKHYRFSRTFAWINRHLRSRRDAIKKIRLLYQKLGLVNDGCSLCKNFDFSLISEGDRYGFDLDKQICNQCGLVQTYPALSPEFHQEFYSYHYRPLYLKDKNVDYHSVIKEQTEKGIKYLEYLTDNGLNELLKDLSVIEIGCSSAGTIKTLKPHVKSVQGCDLDIEAIKFARENFQLNVEVGMYPSSLPEGKKLFIMSHVLEHVFNPLKTLTEVRKLLEKGDYLFIAVPGLNMVAKGDYKNDLRRYFHIAHVTDFTSNTLGNVAHCAGFKTLSIDEEINGLFVADEIKTWKKSFHDSIDNVLQIEKTYKGIPPHL
jgi:SAM-dependent methyltransferase